MQTFTAASNPTPRLQPLLDLREHQKINYSKLTVSRVRQYE